MVVTGDASGTIRGWNVPSSGNIDPYGVNKDTSFSCMTWDEAHEKEPIWDLRSHPTESLLLSAGADAHVALW
jgi:WD40 repeat protein